MHSACLAGKIFSFIGSIEISIDIHCTSPKQLRVVAVAAGTTAATIHI
jgi:hypothetical protein